jgi:hypothetical protein
MWVYNIPTESHPEKVQESTKNTADTLNQVTIILSTVTVQLMLRLFNAAGGLFDCFILEHNDYSALKKVIISWR